MKESIVISNKGINIEKIIFTVSIILFSLSIKAQTQVVNAKKDKNSTISSISYSLPKNVLQIRFVIKHDIYKGREICGQYK